MRGVFAGVVAGALALLAFGCAPVHPAGAGASAPQLLPSVQATVGPDSVYFVLQVTNAGTSPVELTFPSGQEFDFAVLSAGREVWRWSAGRAFTQALHAGRLSAGETASYGATWSPPAGASGEYAVVGTLTARGARVEQTTSFRLP